MCVWGGVCTWWFVNSYVAQGHTTCLLEVSETLLSLYTCQLADPRVIGSLKIRKL